MPKITSGSRSGAAVRSAGWSQTAQWPPGFPCPAPYVTSVVFVGETLDLVAITTATADLYDRQLAEYPMA